MKQGSKSDNHQSEKDSELQVLKSILLSRGVKQSELVGLNYEQVSKLSDELDKIDRRENHARRTRLIFRSLGKVVWIIIILNLSVILEGTATKSAVDIFIAALVIVNILWILGVHSLWSISLQFLILGIYLMFAVGGVWGLVIGFFICLFTYPFIDIGNKLDSKNYSNVI